jgi:saccharopine dehydrogenase-like NADP-dependent oxidoreductase
MPRRIVLIGATGFFGQRLARRLASIDDIDLILTSRGEARAKAFAHDLGGARIGALAFVRDDAASTERLKSVSPWLVIDASGPFQAASYDLARTAIGLGAHWIDLADARDYLLGFGPALDGVAREGRGGTYRRKFDTCPVDGGRRTADARAEPCRQRRHCDYARRCRQRRRVRDPGDPFL